MGRTLLIICGVVVALGLMGSVPTPDKTYESDQTDAQREIASALQSIAASAKKTEPGIATPTTDLPCERSRENRESDLCAQWKAADAARDAANWSLIAAGLSAAGLAALLVTINQGRIALSRAREANEIAKKSSERQLRAYLNIQDVYATGVWNGGEPVVHYTIRNGGQTPARKVTIRVCLITAHKGDGRPRVEFLKGRIPVIDIAPGRDSKQSIPDNAGPLTAGHWEHFLAGDWAFEIAGYISYRDVFGKFRRTIFRAHTPNEHSFDGRLDLAASPKHYRST